MENNQCKICGAERSKIFSKRFLEKYDVSFFECQDCGFIQTEKPYWLKEAYSSAITSTDVGLVHRNVMYSDVIEKIIYRHFDKNNRFLDFAGGYGLFTRLMRDKGLNFWREDKFCKNLFAKFFDIENLSENERKFELVTAFEMMEHIENPYKELDKIFSMTDNFLFSTELVPENDLEGWWYLGAEHGQHISFFTDKSLKKIAERYGGTYYPSGSLHFIGRKKTNIFEGMEKYALPSGKLESKMWSDFKWVVKKVNNK